MFVPVVLSPPYTEQYFRWALLCSSWFLSNLWEGVHRVFQFFSFIGKCGSKLSVRPTEQCSCCAGCISPRTYYQGHFIYIRLICLLLQFSPSQTATGPRQPADSQWSSPVRGGRGTCGNNRLFFNS